MGRPTKIKLDCIIMDMKSPGLSQVAAQVRNKGRKTGATGYHKFTQ